VQHLCRDVYQSAYKNSAGKPFRPSAFDLPFCTGFLVIFAISSLLGFALLLRPPWIGLVPYMKYLMVLLFGKDNCEAVCGEQEHTMVNFPFSTGT